MMGGISGGISGAYWHDMPCEHLALHILPPYFMYMYS